MTIPTILVNAYDLIWDDIDIDPNDVKPFFFKEDPVSYIRKLKSQGWSVFLYGEFIEKENERCTQFRHVGWLYDKINVMSNLFDFLGPILSVYDIRDIVANADKSSPVIINHDREFLGKLDRHTPFEIFGTVDPPTLQPNSKVLQM
ncbi:Hypothetical protein HVR_LOCUS903 [uncultured virus]|nr:Hypothetical protein HVR_LOCUS903 [uncultured virus]